MSFSTKPRTASIPAKVYKFLVCKTQFLVFDTHFIVFKTKFIIVSHFTIRMRAMSCKINRKSSVFQPQISRKAVEKQPKVNTKNQSKINKPKSPAASQSPDAVQNQHFSIERS